ncbi:tRNA (adenine(22)-N(1))-methyltransferase [Howardella ureilytica]
MIDGISKRLKSVANFIPRACRVCDVGTDHGYLPVYLSQTGIAKSIIAMDLREKPLQKAKNNAKDANVFNIDFRLSDGLEKLEKNEADVITITGMGGYLIINILKKALERNLFSEGMRIIVSPHSDYRELRYFLYRNGFLILEENAMYENKWFYNIISAKYDGVTRSADEVVLSYGSHCLESRNAALKKYLLHESMVLRGVIEDVSESDSDSAKAKAEELKDKLAVNREALLYFL